MRRERPLTDQLNGHIRFSPPQDYTVVKSLCAAQSSAAPTFNAEDALLAALKVKGERPDATIMYLRRLNRRGDTRHPPPLTGGRNPTRSVSG